MLEATADDSVVTHAFNVGMPVPGPHRVLRRSIDGGETPSPTSSPVRSAASSSQRAVRALAAVTLRDR